MSKIGAMSSNSKHNYAFCSVKQAEVFNGVLSFYNQYHTVPTCRELCSLMGWSSTATAMQTLRRLVSAGLLVRKELPGGRIVLTPAGRHIINAKPAKTPK